MSPKIQFDEAIVAHGEQACDCNATGVGLTPTQKNGLLFINILISSFWYRGKKAHAMQVENGVS